MDGRTLTCVYCGHEYPQDTPAHGDGVLTEHIKICERHPMRKAEQDTALLRSALDALQDDALDLQAKLEDALKDRVALAMALDCGHRPLCEECRLYSPAAKQQPSVPEGWKQAVALAYGHLWHVNNEPMAPIPLRSSETAAYEARKQLRDLLTHEERGLAINQVQAMLAASPQPKDMK